MKRSLCTIALTLILAGCFSDPLVDGTDPYAPTVFKEGLSPLPLNPPNKKYLAPFLVSQTTVFTFAVDRESIKIGNDGVTRYIVVITNPSGGQNTYFEGIRCDTSNGVSMAHWRPISSGAPILWVNGFPYAIMFPIDIKQRLQRVLFVIWPLKRKVSLKF